MAQDVGKYGAQSSLLDYIYGITYRSGKSGVLSSFTSTMAQICGYTPLDMSVMVSMQ